MKTYQEIFDTLEDIATQKFLAYAALCREHPHSPEKAAFRKAWQTASNDLRDLLRHMNENGIEPGDVCRDVFDERKAS